MNARVNTKSTRIDGGFTLATLLVISTTLMIMGAAILQGTLSVKNFLNDQYYNGLAREAAEAGTRYAQVCIGQNATWTELRPETNCTGTNTTAPSFVLETETYRSTFTVGALDTRADGSSIAVAKGKVELLRRETGSAYKTYNETLVQAVGVATMTVLPAHMETGGSANPDTMAFMKGYDGNLYGMGENSDGRLGDGTTIDRNSPVKFNLPTEVSAKKVSAAYNFAAVLGSDGKVYSAGNNRDGQFGTGNTDNYSTPVEFPLPAGIFAVDVAAGGGGAGYNVYVLTSNGRVYGAGSNADGQLLGTNVANQLTPKLLSLPTGVTRINKIAYTKTTNDTTDLVVVGNNGTVWGIGNNNDLQLGTTDHANKTAWTQLQVTASNYKANEIVDGYHSVFIHAQNAQVYGFGRGGAGQMGSGTALAEHSTATLFDLPGTLTVQKFIPASSSNVTYTGNIQEASSYALASDHQVYGAGLNHNGQLGNGNTTNQATPVKFNLPAGLTAVDLDAKYFTTCVLASNRQVYCAGRNEFGQLGDGTTINRSTPVKFGIPDGILAVDVTVAFSEVYVTTADGKIYAAGKNDNGQLGIGNNIDQSTPVAVKSPVVPLKRTPLSASLSYASTSVLTSDGQVFSVGRNANGELGNGEKTDPVTTPVRFQLSSGYAVSVKRAFYGMLVLSSTGQLYGAGVNNEHQLGVASTADQATPVQFPITNINANFWVKDYQPSTSTGEETTIVRASSNQLYSIGPNSQGQSGNGTATPVTSISSSARFLFPSGVTSMKMWFGDGGDNNTTYALGTDEKVYASGKNNYGQLGDATTTTPISSPVTSNYPSGCYTKDLDTTSHATYAICRNGSVYAMGRNNYGQLGDGTITTRTAPTLVNLPAGVFADKLVVPRGSWTDGVFAYIIATNGDVYGWGSNQFGQLGDGTTTQRNTPVKMNLPAGITAVDAWPGSKAVFVLGSDGNIYASGANFSGQLGVGDTTNRSTPTKVLLPNGVLGLGGVSSQYALYSVVTKGTPDHFTSFLGSNGKLYMSGYNGHGQLGDGTTTQRTTPVELKLPQPAANAPVLF